MPSSGPLEDLISALVPFFRYAVPATQFQLAFQEAAKRAGWLPAWDRIDARAQKSSAGINSGVSRAEKQELRRQIVKRAYERLKPTPRLQPYSNQSVDALVQEYKRLLAENG